MRKNCEGRQRTSLQFHLALLELLQKDLSVAQRTLFLAIHFKFKSDLGINFHGKRMLASFISKNPAAYTFTDS